MDKEELKKIRFEREEFLRSGTREELIAFDERAEMLKEEVDEEILRLRRDLSELQIIRLTL